MKMHDHTEISPELAFLRAAQKLFHGSLAQLSDDDRKVIAEAIQAGAIPTVSVSHETGPKGNATIECGVVGDGQRMMFSVKTLERIELN